MNATEGHPLDVLLVEDDAALARALAMHLRAERWNVRAAADGEAALDACRERRPDVVVLDLMLPGRSGLDVCLQIRREITPTPGVLVLTARGAEADVVLGFDHGADDYVVKPCRPRELVARLRALGRRAAPGAEALGLDQIVRGAIRVDPLGRRAWVHGVELSLTPTEHELLTTFARHPDRALSREALLQAVFDTSHAGYARNVDCHVVRLRRKLEAAGLSPSPIHTVHGTGYRFAVQAP